VDHTAIKSAIKSSCLNRVEITWNEFLRKRVDISACSAIIIPLLTNNSVTGLLTEVVLFINFNTQDHENET
jgi:hypothetical protein